MYENRQNEQCIENEIDIKELFLIFWKKKFFIIGLSLIGAILTGIYSIFVLPPVYNTDLKIDVNMPETYITKYGEYKLPTSTNGQYLNLITSNEVILNTMKNMGYKDGEETLKSMKDRISVGNINSTNTTQNVFDIKVSAENAEESLKFAETLYKNYVHYVDIVTKERAIGYYYDNFSASLKSQELLLNSTRAILKKNEDLLAQTPETIDQGKLNNIGNNVVIENIINPAFTQLQVDIVENKQLITTTEETIISYKKYLQELDVEKKAIKEYYENKAVNNLEPSEINVAKTNIYLLGEPVAPINKTSPNNILNVAIGLVFGGMLACGVALIKEYWYKKE